MSICVAYGNKVMDTRLPQPTGCGDKYDVLGWYWERMLNSCCLFLKYPLPAGKPAPSPSRGEGLHRPWCDKILCTDCASRPSMTSGRDANSFGRSMIEMLGVLAIIGVLSVGGIAGYSKAMEKYKINKAMHEYSLIIFSLLEHLDSIKNLSTDKDWSSVSLLPYMQQTGLITDAWTPISNNELNDPYGNTIAFFSRHHNLVVDLTLGSLLMGEDATTSPAFSASMCREYFTNLAIPLQSSLIYARLYKLTGTTSSSTFFYGNSTCGSNKKCLHSMTLSDVNDICRSCSKDSACVINLEF
mgnify:FL=1